MSNILVKAIPILGSTMLTALKDAHILAVKLECGVQFDFNGMYCWIYPYDDVEKQFILLQKLKAIKDDTEERREAQPTT